MFADLRRFLFDESLGQGAASQLIRRICSAILTDVRFHTASVESGREGQRVYSYGIPLYSCEMRGYALIAFAVFFGCVVGQIWFLRRVRQKLIDRHPDTFLAMEKSSLFPSGGLWRVIRKGRYKELNDPELDKSVRDLKRLQAISIVAWLAYMISIFTDPMFQH